MGTLHLAVNVFVFYLEAMLGNWLPARLVHYFLSLAPRDYVTYYQAQGLSGHTSPCGECVFFNLEDSMPPEVEGDYLPFSWSDSKWAHLVHSENFFLILNLSSLHPSGKPYLGYSAWRWFTTAH